MKKIKSSPGFTIIEVLIVLAIAAMIMMIMFLAIPEVQRSQRDQRRRNDMAHLYTAIKDYQVNTNNPNSPFNTSTDQAKFDSFKDSYLGPEFSGYTFVLMEYTSSHNFAIVPNQIVFFPQHYCPDNNGEQVSGPGNPIFATMHPPYAWSVLIGLEKSPEYYCLDQGNTDQ